MTDEAKKPATAKQPPEPAASWGTKELEALAAKVEALEASLPDRISEKLSELAGPTFQKFLEEALAPLAAKLEELTAAGEHAADADLERFVQHVNAKVHAIHNALQRAVGIEVPLPLLEDPADKAPGDVKVAGAETAQG